ncbi:hypothetical protein D9619_009548 [Psilocybe cf. subviscida]|uniref:Uncharacterized protein n=1 Tax=Psilocybe cf. subviscida TaxID=2480587 RepID=A0A8H5BMU8_9AGAR|nr:hypothetical protein D9619_009548 [Psilocybe cf. subviscida]
MPKWNGNAATMDALVSLDALSSYLHSDPVERDHGQSMSGVAIITGASRGIGRAIAHRFAKVGFRVALNDLPSGKDALEEVNKDILESGGEAGIYYANISNEDDVQAMVADVVSTMGSVDVMVANAGLCIEKVLIDSKSSFKRPGPL